ncbi:MAG: type II toxin-antitoxin system RelE/ParE family toxin [Planctomycetia bacterium]|nr:type II toxin-antitoxin system RelE/ParE family toxin [Planctomycetia bacterium]
MIKSFADRETEKVFHRVHGRRLPADIQRVALRKPVQIHAAATLEFLRVPPANRLEKLAGDRAGQHSIRINDRWRVCFIWRDGDAYEVEITDHYKR